MRSFRHDQHATRRTPHWSQIAAILALVVSLAARPAVAGTASDVLREKLRHAGDVNDFAKILNPADRAALEQSCRSLREKSGAAFVIVIVDSLEGGEINDFTNKLFKQWEVGQKGKDNGLLLLVALRDRKARLEVGYGLEPIIPDALAGRILDEHLFPAFKQQRYADGLKAAVNRAAQLVERGEPAPQDARQQRAPANPFDQQIFFTVFLALFIAIGSFLLGAGIGAKVVPLCAVGLFLGVIPYVMGWALAAPLAPLVHTPLAILLILVGLRARRSHPKWFRNSRGGSSGADYDTWVWPSSGSNSSGSSWSGGGFSGGFGGFDGGSFGGGSSGGGGASGSW